MNLVLLLLLKIPRLFYLLLCYKNHLIFHKIIHYQLINCFLINLPLLEPPFKSSHNKKGKYFPSCYLAKR